MFMILALGMIIFLSLPAIQAGQTHQENGSSHIGQTYEENTDQTGQTYEEDTYQTGQTYEEEDASYRYQHSREILDRMYQNREVYYRRHTAHWRQFGSLSGRVWGVLFWNQFWDNYHGWSHPSGPNSSSSLAWSVGVPVIIDGPYTIRRGYQYTIIGKGFGNGPGFLELILSNSRMYRLKVVAWCNTAVQFEVLRMPIQTHSPLRARIQITNRAREVDLWPVNFIVR